MKFVTDPREVEKMSNPQDEKTFVESKLDWSEHKKPGHVQLLGLYKAALKLRRELFGNENPPRNHWQVESEANSVTIRYRLRQRRVAVHFRVKPGHDTPVPKGRIILNSNAAEFAGPTPALASETVVVEES